MRTVAVILASLLTVLLYSGPAQAGQRSSFVVTGTSRPTVVVPRSGPTFVVPPPRPTFVVPPSSGVIVQRPFAPGPFIVQGPFVSGPFIVNRPIFVPSFVERRVFFNRQVLIVRRGGFESPFIVQRGFLPRNQVLVFDRFGRRLN